jgi:hypothetical protein
MRPRLLLVGILLVILGAAGAQATQVIPRTPADLGERSSLVVRGTIADTRSFWSPSRTKILTEITVDVEEGYKGSVPSTVRILQLGGAVDGVRVTVAGALAWRPSEEVLLFLEPYVPGAYQVAGFSQGKFEIQRDARTGEAFVSRRALAGLEMLSAGPRKAAQAAAPVERVSLERFLDEALPGSERR